MSYHVVRRADVLRRTTTYCAARQRTTTYCDILRDGPDVDNSFGVLHARDALPQTSATYYDVLRRTTTYYDVLR
eukprot:10723256-Alexandrium_andersonii.AAC.1